MSDKLIILLSVGVVAVVMVGGIMTTAFGIMPENNEGDDEISVENLSVINVDASSTEEYVNGVMDENGVYNIRGRIVGNSGGGDVFVDSVSESSDRVTIRLDVNTSGIGTTVITGYEYEAEVHNVNDRDLVVSYGDSEFVVGEDDENLNNGGDSTDNNMSGNSVSANLTDSSSNSAMTDERSEVSFDGNKAVATGTIVGNTGGQTVFIDDVENRDGTTYLDVGLESPDGFATQVITGYQYEIKLTDPADRVVVEHQGNVVGKYDNQDSSSNESDFTYDFYADRGDATDVAELVDQTADSFVLEGSYLTGSSTCSKASLDSIRVENDTMYVKLSPQSVQPIDGLCTEDIAPSSYQLDVQSVENIETVIVQAEQKYNDDKRKQIDL